MRTDSKGRNSISQERVLTVFNKTTCARRSCFKMTDEVINFPRGGKRTKASRHNDRDKDLFQVGDDVSPAKRRKKDVEKTKVERKKLRHNDKRIEPLSFQKLTEDQVILGIVKDVKDHQLMVSLPNGLNGMVSIMEISSPFLKRLEQLAKADAYADETLLTLKKLYQIGDPVPCSVISTKTEGQKRLIDLSINPSIVNKGLPLSALKTGCLIFGAVASKEEHGYTIDLGIPDIMAFLKAKTEKDDANLVVGKCFWFSLLKDLDVDVTAGESRVVNVSIAPEHVQEAKVTLQKAVSIECFRPGMKIDVKITQTASDGLQVKFMQYNGCIHKGHLPNSPTSYNIGQEVEARVLYTAALTKEIYLSLLPRVVNCIGVELQPLPMSVGDVREWEVLRVEQNHGVYFQAQGITGLASLSQLSDEKIENPNIAFVRNTTHRCRVIGFHHIDDVALLTLKESVLNEKFLSISDVHPGQIVKCSVLKIHSSGLIVQLSKHITALVPNLHVADVPLKNIEKKFSEGDKLKCRVLKVDVQKKKILLSHKKSLVTTSQKVPTSYFDISHGDLLEGFVIAIKNSGVVVSFCNDVKGWVPCSELSTEDIVHPETLFYLSQVVRCRVLTCSPEEEKLTLSFIIFGKRPLAANQKKMKNFEVGKLVEAKIIKKEKHSLILELQPSGDGAILSKDHLSDSRDNQELLWQALKPGQIIKDLMLLKQANVVVTTLKESFISAAKEGFIPKSFSDVKPGQLMPGVVKNHQDFGIFVELPGGLTGLAPLRFTMNRQVPDLAAVFACGQSVVVKVMQVKEENQRFLCSLRMCDCYSDDPAVGLELLNNYLREREFWMHTILEEKACNLKTGSLEIIEIEVATEYGYVCRTMWGMKVLVTQFHAGGVELPIGTRVEGVVLHVDAVNKRLVMSTDRDLVRDVSRRIEKPTMDKARKGQSVKAEVVFFTDDFVLVALKQHAVGMFAYIPTKQHLNDVTAKAAFSLGEQTRVVIQQDDGREVFAELENRIPAALSEKGKLTGRHDFQLGQIVTAIIHDIYPGQMNIKIGHIPARVHITEVVDKISEGSLVYKGYKKGQEVKVKIIGFRSLKSQKYLPISHPKFHTAVPECTLRPSKLDHDGYVETDLSSYSQKLKTGDKVLVYPIQYEHNKLWVNVSTTQTGFISIFDLSNNLGVLQHPEKHFLQSHGYTATVLSVEDQGLLHLTFTGRREQVLVGEKVKGKVTSISDNRIYLRFPDGYRGQLLATDALLKNVKVGQFLKVYIESCEEQEKCSLHLHKPTRTSAKDQPQQNSLKSPNEKQKRKLSVTVQQKANERSEAKVERLNVLDSFSWEPLTSVDLPSSNEEEDEEDISEEEPKKKKKKISSQTTVSPESSAEQPVDFDKLLLSQPDNSMLWIQYMSKYLNEGDVDKARGVAEQALKTISFREEQEKLNIWIALLNLENRHGSKEQVTNTLHRALQVNDPLSLYRRVAAMFTTGDQFENAEQTYQTMVRKFKQNKQVWVEFGLFLFKQGRLDAARNLLQRSLLSLEKRDHVETISKFAQLEYNHGNPERGATMFEKIIAEFPRRSDIMSVYIDMVTKQGDLHKARELLDRGLASKSAQFFLKKYLQFEEKYGNDETRAKVQALIEKSC